MAEPPPLNAAFFAFRKREPRFVLTRAAAGYLLGYVIVFGLYLALMWSTLGAMYAWYFDLIAQVLRDGGQPPSLPDNLFARWPAMALVALLGFILFAAFEAACLRWLVRREHGGGVLGLNLGADTWRVFAVYLAWIGLMTAFCIGVGVLYAGIGALSAAVPALRFVIVFVAVLAPLALLGLLVWLSVRLAPAAALSIARQRFVFFDAWRLTRPYFWQMLGAFVVLWIGYFVVALVLGSIVELPLTQAMTPIMQEAMSGGDAGELAARMMALWTSPTTMAFMGLSLIVSAAIACVLYIAFFGVNARVVEAAGEERGGAGAGA